MYMKKYLLLAAAAMMAATSAWSETVTTEAELNDALNVFDVDIDVKLGADITLSNYLGITNGKNVTLDLNGHTLKRNLSGANDYGSVIRVSTGSKLTIEDSSGDNSGTITGGRSTYGGGISNHGSLTLMGGTISSNLATGAGGGLTLLLRWAEHLPSSTCKGVSSSVTGVLTEAASITTGVAASALAAVSSAATPAMPVAAVW